VARYLPSDGERRGVGIGGMAGSGVAGAAIGGILGGILGGSDT
jgi:hypothetical protein